MFKKSSGLKTVVDGDECMKWALCLTKSKTKLHLFTLATKNRVVVSVALQYRKETWNYTTHKGHFATIWG